MVKVDRHKPGVIDVSKIDVAVSYGGVKPGKYIKAVARTIDATYKKYANTVLADISDAFFDTWRRGGRIIWMGNGGNGANASHAGADMGRRSRLGGMPFVQSLAITDNVESILAQANDEGFDTIFVTQLEGMRIGFDDTIVGLSGSGNSANVLKAIQYANEQKANTVGISGFNGGKLVGLAKIRLVIPCEFLDKVKSNDKHGPTMAGTEDVTMCILHEQFEIMLDRIQEAKRTVFQQQ